MRPSRGGGGNKLFLDLTLSIYLNRGARDKTLRDDERSHGQHVVIRGLMVGAETILRFQLVLYGHRNQNYLATYISPRSSNLG